MSNYGNLTCSSFCYGDKLYSNTIYLAIKSTFKQNYDT